jgi:hypothetical protein
MPSPHFQRTFGIAPSSRDRHTTFPVLVPRAPTETHLNYHSMVASVRLERSDSKPIQTSTPASRATVPCRGRHVINKMYSTDYF